MGDVMDARETREILGVRLPVDAEGRVDLSRVHHGDRDARRSPSEWARTGRFTHVLRTIEGKTGLPRSALWVVEGTKKVARTWVHPEIAEAYLKELGFGGRTLDDLAGAFEGLAAGVADLERQVAGWKDGVDALRRAVADVERRLSDIELQSGGWGEGLE